MATKQTSTVKPTVNIETLKYRINNFNTAQQVKKQQLGLLPNIWSSNNAGMYRQRFYSLQGNETGIDQISREQIVRLSRELFFQLPCIGVASELKAEYVVGDDWDLVYNGNNTKWGKEAEDFINNKWYNNPSIKGFAYDFKTILRTLSTTLDMDGDVLMLFVHNNNNFPVLQFIGSHRVGSNGANTTGRSGNLVTINGKEYTCLDGIVYDSDKKPVAYSIKKDDAQIATVPQDLKQPVDDFISAENAQLVFNPKVFDKGRGLPALYASVLYGLQVSDLENFLMDIAKLHATIAYVEKNDSGQAPQEYENLLNEIQAAGTNNNPVNLPSLEPTVHGVSVVKSPTIRYVKSDGGDLKSFDSNNPSEEIQSYIRTIETKLLSAIGVPHQLIYSPEMISGRGVNAIQQMMKKTIAARQRILKRYAKLAVTWVLSVAMEEGLISKNYEEDIFSSIDFTLPPEFTLDTNQDKNMDLELYKVGLISGEEFCRKNNDSYQETSVSRKEEIHSLLSDIEEMKTLHPEMSEAAILNLFTQRGQSTLRIEDQEAPQPQTVTPNQ